MTGFRWTIKRKLLALGGGTLLVLLALLAFWAWWEVREHAEGAEAELTLASQQAAGHLEALFREVTEHLAALARNAAVQHRQVERMEELFHEVTAVHPEVENVFAVGADGLTVASAVPRPAGAPITVADRPWFQRVMATGRPAVGGFQIGWFTGRPVAFASREAWICPVMSSLPPNPPPINWPRMRTRSCGQPSARATCSRSW